MNSDLVSTNIKISFGKEKSQNMNNFNEIDNNFDDFNDETFGEIDSTDWESEHEKLMSITNHRSDPDFDSNSNRNRFIENESIHENLIEDDLHYGLDDIVVKSISNLGLEDEDFDDPAIMTFGRSTKPMPDTSRRTSRSSPPPPAILSYEEYSASPKTSTIWSTTQMDSNITQTMNTSKMRTLEDIENDLINRNNNQLIQRQIKLENLEANLLDESTNRQMSNSADRGWSQFTINSRHSFNRFQPNGGINSEVMPNVDNNFDNNFRQNFAPNMSLIKQNHSPIDPILQMAAQQVVSNAAQESKHDSIEPLLNAQTLTEIERQLISGQSPPQRPKPSENITLPEPPTQHMRPNPAQVAHSPNKSFGPQFNQFRPQMLGQNRVNNIYNRPPVMHLVPGMHPSVGRTLFSPALIPNSQRIFPFPLQSRPIMHPMLQMQAQQQLLNQQQRHSHQSHHNYNNFRHQNRYYDNHQNEDEYSGLMTQRDIEWLKKVQQMQTDLKDPYVDDYYYVTYISRKIAAKAANDKENKTTPSLLLPVRPKPVVEPESAKYIPVQFEGSLGKIQVSNVNCPRKLLDCKLNKTNVTPIQSSNDHKVVVTKSEVQRFRKLLLQIEKLYVVLINIDDEDKRIGALPEEARRPHLETRSQLCDKLFRGLTNETNDKINSEVVQIKKGLALLFRSLSYLSDESHRSVIISDLLNANNFKQYIIKSKDRLDFGQMLVNAILDTNSYKHLIKIIENINNINVIIKSEYGKTILESLINQFEKLWTKGENYSEWSIFVNYVLDESEEIQELSELRTMCRNHLTKMSF